MVYQTGPSMFTKRTLLLWMPIFVKSWVAAAVNHWEPLRWFGNGSKGLQSHFPIYSYIYILIYILVCILIYTYIHIYICVYKYIYKSIYILAYIYIYISIYLYSVIYPQRCENLKEIFVVYILYWLQTYQEKNLHSPIRSLWIWTITAFQDR